MSGLTGVLPDGLPLSGSAQLFSSGCTSWWANSILNFFMALSFPAFFWKYICVQNHCIHNTHIKQAKKPSFPPFYRFTVECIVHQQLVTLIYTTHVSVVISNKLGFAYRFCTRSGLKTSKYRISRFDREYLWTATKYRRSENAIENCNHSPYVPTKFGELWSTNDPEPTRGNLQCSPDPRPLSWW